MSACVLICGAAACAPQSSSVTGTGGTGATAGSTGSGGTSAAGTSGTAGAAGGTSGVAGTGGTTGAAGGASGSAGGNTGGSGGTSGTAGAGGSATGVAGTGGGSAGRGGGAGGGASGSAGTTGTAGTGGTATGASDGAVVTNRYDNVRSGANLGETALTVASVGGGKFGLLFSRMVDGHVYAQPLYLPNLTIGGAEHNVVFVATEANTVFAYDADSATATAPLWMKSLGTPMRTYPGIENQPVDAAQHGFLPGHVPADRHHLDAGDRSARPAGCTSSARTSRATSTPSGCTRSTS